LAGLTDAPVLENLAQLANEVFDAFSPVNRFELSSEIVPDTDPR
jgi:hypothetical protein